MTRRGRFLIAAFGDAGHAFPAIALARALGERGGAVLVETWERWREPIEALGLEFVAAEEYRVFPPPPPGEGRAGPAEAARPLVPMIEDWSPDVVVSDILTLAPALAAEVAGVSRATLIPHVYPVHEPGQPFFAVGMQPPRTPVGRALWRAGLPLLETGLRRGRRELNAQRAKLGLPPVGRFHGGISEDLALVGTFPQLEYPRRWPPGVEVVGPLEFELPHPDVELPSGSEPLILVAPSTAQDREGRLLRASLEALADEPVRVIATTNRALPAEELDAPGNAVVVDWLSYAQVMPEAALVICHGGHGTVCRSLGSGAPVLACPAVGDMAENAARVSWARVGLSLPWQLCHPPAVRWAVRGILGDSGYRDRARAIREWRSSNDGAIRGARLVEELATGA